LVEKYQRREHSEDLGADEKAVLKLISRIWGARILIGFRWFRIGSNGVLFDDGDKPSDATRKRHILTRLTTINIRVDCAMTLNTWGQ